MICLSLGILGPNEREYLGDDLKEVDVFPPRVIQYVIKNNAGFLKGSRRCFYMFIKWTFNKKPTGNPRPVFLCCLGDLHCANFVFRDTGDGIQCRVGQLVGRRLGEMKGDEYGAVHGHP